MSTPSPSKGKSRPKAVNPPRLRVSSSRVIRTRSFRQSWERWRLSRIPKKVAKAETRLILLQAETDHQLLLLKELRQQEASLLHRQQEQMESLQWHRQQLEAETPPLLESPASLAMRQSTPTTGPQS